MNKTFLSQGLLFLLPLFLLSSPSFGEERELDLSAEDKTLIQKTINIAEEFYHLSVNKNHMIKKGAIRVVEHIDTHNLFLENALQKEIKRNKGIGIVFAFEKGNSYLEVLTVYPGSSAHEAGLKAGNIIWRIQGLSISSYTSRQHILKALTGQNKQVISLAIYEDRNFLTRKQVKVTVGKLGIPISICKPIQDNVLYIKYQTFQKGDADLLTKCLQKHSYKGILFDLRETAGGQTEETLKITDLFLNKGQQLLTLEFNDGETKSYRSQTAAAAPQVPLVLLISHTTAFSGELIAGILKHQNRATLMGSKTMGQGSFQQSFPLDQNYTLLLTTAWFQLPNKQWIKDGILPHISIKPHDETLIIKDFLPDKPDDDTLLARKHAIDKTHLPHTEDSISQNKLQEHILQQKTLKIGGKIDNTLQRALDLINSLATLN